MCIAFIGTHTFDMSADAPKRVAPYINDVRDGLSSRLFMYWNSKATDVFIDGEFYHHAGGDSAQVATVMFTGARGHATKYRRPQLSEIVPYSEDTRGLWLRNGSIPGEPYEWAAIGQTGRIVESINCEILGLALEAAEYGMGSSDSAYIETAFKVLDTYMKGIYYRNVPIDLNHGHQQTLVGMTSFEVIHEDALNPLIKLYKALKPYINNNCPKNRAIYDDALKKFADNIIDKGVPHNNWDLIQARFIMDIAMALDGDEVYSDGRGSQYYIDRVVSTSSLRQWSLKDLATYGFDSNTAIWRECPGYSMGVLGDFCSLMRLFDTTLDRDLLIDLPMLPDAVAAMPQYMFPNRLSVGFGDTHPGEVRRSAINDMIAHYRQWGDEAGVSRFKKILRVYDFSANIDSLVSSTFYSPNVSWIVQRSGMDKDNSLMVSINGSDGNHAHANGISMELYGKGLTLAPDAGIGKSLYQGQDYLEYYSQFPAHNTVCVDGISSYPVMKSNHPFKVNALFPASSTDYGSFSPLTFSEVDFTEPETNASQRRINAIIPFGDGGYYIDIFRSRRNDNTDGFHDYFYHNLGQRMKIKTIDGDSLAFEPTEELSFAGAHLYAYSYIYKQQKADGYLPIKATFTIDMPDSTVVDMNMWFSGANGRKIYKAESPMTEGLSRLKSMPYDIASTPTLTFISRQMGEAWNRPFAAVFEPSTSGNPANILSVDFNSSTNGVQAIKVQLKGGFTDYIVSSDSLCDMVIAPGFKFKCKAGMVRLDADGNPQILFISDGTYLKGMNITLKSLSPVSVLLIRENGKWTKIGDNASFSFRY
jgi:hypothetical protein